LMVLPDAGASRRDNAGAARLMSREGYPFVAESSTPDGIHKPGGCSCQRLPLRAQTSPLMKACVPRAP
jgi:hypothetical protein